MSQMVRSTKDRPTPAPPAPEPETAAETTPTTATPTADAAPTPTDNPPSEAPAAPFLAAADSIPAPRPKVTPPPEPEPEPEELDLDALLDKAAKEVQEDLGKTAKTPAPAPAPASEEPIDVYKRLMLVAQAVVEGVTWKSALDGNLIIDVLRTAHKLLQKDDELLTELIRYRGEEHSWAIRGANTALIAMSLGRELRFDEKRCLGVGLCSLMHDLGMLKLPPELLASQKDFTDQEITLLHRHPLESQQIVKDFDASFAWIADIVVQVHERLDGSGYPHGLKGGKSIHEFAQIIGLADTYEAMTFPRPDRKAKVAYAALKELLTKGQHLFDRNLIKSLVDIVSMFPLGSLIKLNNNEVGRVIRTNRQHPTRPIVEMALDGRGRPVTKERIVDLVDEPMLYIMDPAIEEKVVQRAIKRQSGSD